MIFRLKVGVLLPNKAQIDSKMDNINRFLKIQGSISNVRGTDVYSSRRPTIFPQTTIEVGTIPPQIDTLFSFKMLQNREVNLNLYIVLA